MAGTSKELELNSIELLIKALGTMVIFPSYEKDPTNIGKVNFTGPIQQPILVDSQREIALNKLTELINKL